MFCKSCCFDPQALTSLTKAVGMAWKKAFRFRSTGSYEPDLPDACPAALPVNSFDPQALTSLTGNGTPD